MKNLRKRLYVDRHVQYDLIMRITIHWVMFVIVACLALSVWSGLVRSDIQRPISDRASEFVTTLLILGISFGTLFPYFLYDTLKLTNRFAGPIIRLRRTMRNAAEGEAVEPIHFRDGDYWREFADEFNALIAYYEGRLAEAKQQAAHSSSEAESDEFVAAAN